MKILLFLLLLASTALAQRAGQTTPNMGLVYEDNQTRNGNWSTIDSFVCSGLGNAKCIVCSPMQPCTISASWTINAPWNFTVPVNAPFMVQSTDPTAVHLLVEGLAGQTGDLQDWKKVNTDSTPILWVDASGALNGNRVVLTGLPSQTANLTDWKLHAADSGPTIWIDTAGNLNFTQMGTAFSPANIAYDLTDGSLVFSSMELTGKFFNNSGANFRTISGCTTAATAGANCTDTLGWPVTFPSANYRPECTCEWISGVPIIYVSNLTTTNMQITTTAMTAVATRCRQIHCIAFAD